MSFEDLVTIAKWSHLFPSRTQKLSISSANIAMLAIVKLASCQVILYTRVYSLVFFCKKSLTSHGIIGNIIALSIYHRQ